MTAQDRALDTATEHTAGARRRRGGQIDSLNWQSREALLLKRNYRSAQAGMQAQGCCLLDSAPQGCMQEASRGYAELTLNPQG